MNKTNKKKHIYIYEQHKNTYYTTQIENLLETIYNR